MDTAPLLSGQARVLGLELQFIDIDADRNPDGMRISCTKPGALVPCHEQIVPAGSALLVLPPHVAAQLRTQAMAQQVRR